MRPIRLTVTVLAVLCTGAVLDGADGAPFRFPRSTPEAQGISSSAILEFVQQAEERLDALHSFMLVRHGQVVAEGWWAPYAADEPHMMFSLSKSFTSTAVGLAISEGKLSLDDPVLRFFPDEAPDAPGDNLKALRIRDLLTMSTGHHEDAIRGFPYDAEDSVVKRFLALPVAHKPGTFFLYNTPASYMLSAIVQKVTGQTVLDYLRPRLFEPLGIVNPTWEASKQGISMGGFGLSVRTEDIARFGQLYLQKGRWQGRQLVPEAWVEAATARQMSNGSSPASDWEQGYGYQFWRSRHGFYRGDGAHGQFCIVMPQYDAVVAITSGTRDMASVMNLVWDRIVPAMQDAPLPADPAAQQALTTKLASLTLRPQAGQPMSASARGHVGTRYTFGENPQSIEAITLQSSDTNGETRFVVRIKGVEQQIAAAPGAWRKGSITIDGVAEPVAASGGWTSGDTYTLRVSRYRTPFATTYTMRFDGDRLVLDTEQNVGAADTRTAHMVGTVQPVGSGSRE